MTAVGRTDRDRALADTTLREISARPPDLLVIPVGSLEQHGPHLPLGTDTAHAEAVAYLAVDLLEDLVAMVGPPVSYGCSDHHLPFGGTLSLSNATLLAVLGDIVRTAAASGFKRVFFLNGHGGNHEAVQVVARDGEQSFGIPVGAGSWWDISRKALMETVAGDRVHLPGHAGGFETAVMEALLNEEISDLPPRSDIGTTSDESRSENSLNTALLDRWASTVGYTDQPGALSIEDGHRILGVAAAAVATALESFVGATPSMSGETSS